jgi:hypothetical protein
MDPAKSSSMYEPPRRKQRKSYSRPQLSVYGNITRLTETASNMSATADGGVWPKSKTA